MTCNAAMLGSGWMKGRIAICVAVAGWTCTLLVFAPGYAMYDTLAQYAQASSGRYDDWHPPVMARLWALFAPDRTGTAVMFMLQVSGWWAAFGSIAWALDRRGRSVAAAATIAIALLPPFLGWQVTVLKDAQMIAALLVAAAFVGAPRLAGEAVTPWRWVLASVLIGYACLVRANAAFAAIPLLAMLLPAGWVRRVAITAVGLASVLTISPVINHRVFNAQPSGVERTQAIYDLAGIAVRTGSGPLSAAAIKRLQARGCVRPFFWDPLGEPDRCADDVANLQARSAGTLYVALAGQVVTHPLAYVAHRLIHLNSTGRWIVPPGWPGAAPPDGNEPNDAGLSAPGQIADHWQHLGAVIAETPIGWPFVFVGLAIVALAGLGRTAGADADFARALVVSALALEASFAVVSIASDLRYHLWAMVATALAWVIAWPRLNRRRSAIGVFIIGLTLVPAVAARILLPAAPSSYEAMLG